MAVPVSQLLNMKVFVNFIKTYIKAKSLNSFSNAIPYIGFLAAFWSSLALCPTELVKCRLQAMRESHIEQGREPPKIGPYKLTSQILR